MRSEDYTALCDVVRFHRRTLPHKAAIVFENRVRTYKDIDLSSDRVAAGLTELGVVKGDRVAILGKNSDRFFECLFGANKIGAAFLPINWRLAPAESEYILQNAEVQVLFIDREFVDRLAEISAPNIRAKIVVDGHIPGCIEFDSWCDASGNIVDQTELSASDVALQIYTSGTTGRPKGAMLTNANLAKHCDLDRDPTPDWFRISSDDVQLVAIPTFHVGGIEASLRVLFAGGTLVLHREFDPHRIIEDIERWRVTQTGLVPAALQMIMQHPAASQADFSSLQTLRYGASPIPLEMLKAALPIFKCNFVQAYGMTETTSTVIALGPADHDPDGNERMRSAGKPLPGAEAKIIDFEGNALPPRAVGEILLRSPAVMAGYWKQPGATSAAIDNDGWLRTGDAGYLDEDGYVYVCDRIKDMIISGGENIYPAEVEGVIFAHPQVREVAVIGVSDRQWGEAVKAIIAPHEGEKIDADALIAWTRARIAHYKAPRSVQIVTTLPRNASGKVLKEELRREFGAAS